MTRGRSVLRAPVASRTTRPPESQMTGQAGAYPAEKGRR